MKISTFLFVSNLGVFLVFSLACGSAATNNAANAANANTNSLVILEPAGTPSSGSAQSQTGTPEALVAELYKQHDAKKSPFFQTKDRALVDKYFTKPTADLIWKDATSSKNEVGALDGDPLYAAQDIEIKNCAVGKSEIKGETATVPVNFTNFGEKKTVTFTLKLINSNWKIDDIKWPEGDSMVNVIKDTYPGKALNTPAYDGFGGKYQVGDTTCTVKPVKMAVEVRWAKGSGVEMFFSKNETTFETDTTKDGGTNRFAFEDTDYNTGTFYRADGKTLPVKRSK